MHQRDAIHARMQEQSINMFNKFLAERDNFTLTLPTAWDISVGGYVGGNEPGLLNIFGVPSISHEQTGPC